MAGYLPVILDTQKSSYNTDLECIAKAYRNDVGAIYLVHTYGVPSDVSRIYEFCKSKNIQLVEDCSQSPFAKFNHNGEDLYVGELGDYAIFSTMYRKTLQTSSSGGIVFTKNSDNYKKAVEYSDRGRPKWSESMSKELEGDISRFSLNFNTSEFACSVGLASLARIDEAIAERNRLVTQLKTSLKPLSKFLDVMDFPDGASPFLVPIILTDMGLREKEIIFDALSQACIPYAPKYHCFAYDWKMLDSIRAKSRWLASISLRARLKYSNNASKLKEKTFNIFLHEGYTSDYINFVSGALTKALATSS